MVSILREGVVGRKPKGLNNRRFPYSVSSKNYKFMVDVVHLFLKNNLAISHLLILLFRDIFLLLKSLSPFFLYCSYICPPAIILH